MRENPLRKPRDQTGPARMAPIFAGRSPASRRVQSRVLELVGQLDPILLVGPEGSGKRAIAEILHHFGGGGAALSIVPVDRVGRVGEIGAFGYLALVEDLSFNEQARIPHLVGASRLILATRLDPGSPDGLAALNPELLQMCATRIEVPSLADRIEDLETLTQCIISRTPSSRPVGGLSDAALDCLRAHSWPGNVTQLEQVIREAIEAGMNEQIQLGDLPLDIRLQAIRNASRPPERAFSLAVAERIAIERAMSHAGGNKRKAARLLQIGKTTLYRKLKLYEKLDDSTRD